METHKLSGYFPQEDRNRLSDLHEYFKEESIENVSINDALKVCVNHTYETFHVFGKIDIVHLKNENDELKNENSELKKRVRELELKEKENTKVIQTGIVGLMNCIDLLSKSRQSL
ncbi:hypothetical protein [Halalkalibacter nanhaiisediminis]|uniref:Uncharacterized protein n=1 Tax=Halalkalibacter nanhaiisediminis TaxID=688079 RepID=A0A562QH92_9BACI|nr:hypothetical protein [Halalkalibacter nanhaiisediminis]TWI56085.1 hypothetical protein IQ10_01973 [Halalkalibacter nanhaiisediminis]